MNIELLQAIKAHILAEPETFRMDQFNCGTAQCIGGWACTLSGREWNVNFKGEITCDVRVPGEEGTRDCEYEAADLLGLSLGQSYRLFYEGSWPYRFRTRYQDAFDRALQAEVAAERIDHFIATNGAE